MSLDQCQSAKLKIAFISPNKENMPTPVVPLGILYIMSSLGEEYEKELWDLCFEHDPYQYVIGKIDSFHPDIVAIGIRNLQNNNYSDMTLNLQYYKKLVRTIRLHIDPSVPIIVGGSGFSVMPEKLFSYLEADYGVIGEGEGVFPLLVKAIEEKTESWDHLPGILSIREGKVHRTPLMTPRPIFLDLANMKYPDRRFVSPAYYQITGTENIQSKRGCAFKCSYCTYPKIEGSAYRLRPAKKVVEEMIMRTKEVKEISNFFIVDSVFNWPPKHAKEICRELIEQKFPYPWSCYINPRGFDEELATLLVQAGCHGIEVGSDSGDDTVLKRLNKGFNTEAIINLRNICEKTGLKDCHTLILGTPGEELETVYKTLLFIEKLKPTAVIIMVWKDDDETLDLELQYQRDAFRQEILEVVKERVVANPSWAVPQLEINFSPKLFAMMRKRGYKDPLWIHVPQS